MGKQGKKDCGNHGADDVKDTCRRLLCALLVLAAVAGVVVLVVFLVLRPTHPRFYLQDATLRQVTLLSATTNSSPSSSGSSVLSAALQVTVASRNPNARVGVLYDRLDAYATYKYQQVTLAASLPSTYQGHGDVAVWSPALSSSSGGVPVAPYVADALAKDLADGYLVMQVRIDGRVRWKVGSWTSGRYHIYVTCPAFFIRTTAGNGNGNGVVGANGLKFQTATYCRVEV